MNAEEKFAELLKQHNREQCQCGRRIDRGDVAWNEASTEAGTDCCTIEIICQACDRSIAHVFSWYPTCRDFEEAVRILGEEDWD